MSASSRWAGTWPLTPGAVVYRGEVFELIQYAPQTESVHQRPLLIVPPQINKFYATDLSPGRSFAEFAVRNGVQTFCISWRNPTAAQRDWNVETYLTACKQAIAVAREITGADRVNAMAACAGGFTLATLLGHLAAKGEDRDRERHAAGHRARHRSADACSGSSPRGPASPRPSRNHAAAACSKAARWRACSPGCGPTTSCGCSSPTTGSWAIARRPSTSSTGTPTPRACRRNSTPTCCACSWTIPSRLPGKISALGTPIDMSKVQVPAYVVAGITDHITPWQACYQSKNILRGKIDFVLSSSGHIQSIVNPPTNPKAKYFLNSAHARFGGGLARRRDRTGRQLVGSLGGLVSRARRRRSARATHARQRRAIPRGIPHPAATFTRDDASRTSSTSRSMASTCESRPRRAPADVPLLLFNGIGANLELCFPFMEAMPEKEIVIFDVPGVGRSEMSWRPRRFSGLAQAGQQAARPARLSRGGCHRRVLGRRARAAVRAPVSGALPPAGARGHLARRDHGARHVRRCCRKW